MLNKLLKDDNIFSDVAWFFVNFFGFIIIVVLTPLWIIPYSVYKITVLYGGRK